MHLRLDKDWKACWKWASVQLSAAFATIWAVMPVIANQWPQFAPFIDQYFPQKASWFSIAGALVIILARISTLEKKK